MACDGSFPLRWISYALKLQLFSILFLKLFVGDNLFADDVKEDVDAGGAHEFEVLTDGFQRFIEAAVGAEISLEGAVRFVQIET